MHGKGSSGLWSGGGGGGGLSGVNHSGSLGVSQTEGVEAAEGQCAPAGCVQARGLAVCDQCVTSV